MLGSTGTLRGTLGRSLGQLASLALNFGRYVPATSGSGAAAAAGCLLPPHTGMPVTHPQRASTHTHNGAGGRGPTQRETKKTLCLCRRASTAASRRHGSAVAAASFRADCAASPPRDTGAVASAAPARGGVAEVHAM